MILILFLLRNKIKEGKIKMRKLIVLTFVTLDGVIKPQVDLKRTRQVALSMAGGQQGTGMIFLAL
jgi:hypothetical protein